MALLKVICWALLFITLFIYKNSFSAWQISGYELVMAEKKLGFMNFEVAQILIVQYMKSMSESKCAQHR